MFVFFVTELSLTIVSNVYSCKDDFFDVILRYLLGILQYVFYGITARNTTCHRNGTIGTFVIAAVLNFEKSTGTVSYRVTSYIEIRFVDIARVNLPFVELSEVFYILSNVEFLFGTQYQIHPINSDKVFRLELGIAAYGCNKSIFVVLERFTYNLLELLVRILGNRAGVNYINISRFLKIYLIIALILKATGNGGCLSKI